MCTPRVMKQCCGGCADMLYMFVQVSAVSEHGTLRTQDLQNKSYVHTWELLHRPTYINPVRQYNFELLFSMQNEKIAARVGFE